MSRRPPLPILLALACALFLRALVPAGWMPATGAGGFAIEPCPAAQSTSMANPSGHHHGKHDPAHKAQHDGDCAFAPLLAGFGPAAAGPALTAPMLTAVTPILPSAAPQLKTGPPAPPPPSTGPPALA